MGGTQETQTVIVMHWKAFCHGESLNPGNSKLFLSADFKKKKREKYSTCLAKSADKLPRPGIYSM